MGTLFLLASQPGNNSKKHWAIATCPWCGRMPVVLAAGLKPERRSLRAQILARSGTLPMAMCQVKGPKGLISSFCRVIR